jgi:dTDP-4-amino-4,6-dideoxygalactose transaminase
LALDVHPGDQVVVTAYSYVATANVIELCGARPIFVDIQPDTFNMDPNRLEEALARLMSNDDTARKVRAILPVHTFGQVADMSAIMNLAGRYDLPVIEDAACALGAKWQKRKAGTWGKLGCFSFHPRKAITTGEGGIVVTNDFDLCRRLRTLRSHGFDSEEPLPELVTPGFNYRMTEFQAALGLVQLKKLDRIITTRRSRAAYYNDLLTDSSAEPPVVADDAYHIYQSYVTMLPQNMAERRDELIRHMRTEGIETQIGTYDLPMMTYYRNRYGFQAGDFPVTDSVYTRALTLPLHERIEPDEQQFVCRELQNYLVNGAG